MATKPKSAAETPYLFDLESTAPIATPVAPPPSAKTDSTVVPKVFTYPAVFTPTRQPLKEVAPIQVGAFKYYLGCNKSLDIVAAFSLSYEHARLAMVICHLLQDRGEMREVRSNTGVRSLTCTTSWRELARLFNYTSAPGNDSIKKFNNWMMEMKTYPFAVENTATGKTVATTFIETFWTITDKARSQEEGTLLIQVSNSFYDFLRDMSQSHAIRIDQFLSIESRFAALMYLWLPAFTYKSAAQGQVYQIDAVEALRRIGVQPPQAINGKIYPSKVRQIYEQHGNKSIVSQLRGRATRTGFFQKVWVAQSDEPYGSGVKLCVQECRTIGRERHDATLPGSNSRGILRDYYLTADSTRTDEDYRACRVSLRELVAQTGREFNDYEIEQLEFLGITGDLLRKNRACLLEIKALLGESGLSDVLGEVSSHVREGRTATLTNLHWVIDVAKCFINPKRHEGEHRKRNASRS